MDNYRLDPKNTTTKLKERDRNVESPPTPTSPPTSTPLERVDVHNAGFVELWGFLGSDFTIAASARVSLSRELDSLTGDNQERDRGLINRLMRDRHTSPFEAAVFQFRIRAPLFVNRQWLRHRWASYNEESARYTELVDEFFVPDELRRQVGKPMDYSFLPLAGDELKQRIRDHLAASRQLYALLLREGVAKEQARMVLPVSQYSTFIWTVNALSLMNFMYLRNSSHAQAEIRAYAEAIEGMFATRLPFTHEAFREHWGVGVFN